MPKSGLVVSRVGDVTVVGFADSAALDVVSIQRVGRELYRLADEPPTRKIVIDFDQIRFLSSQALGVLLMLRRRAESAGLDLVFAGLRPELRRVFELAKLDKLFTFLPSRAAALEHLGQTPSESS